MNDTRRALELLEQTSEKLTDMIAALPSGDTRKALYDISEEIDAFLVDVVTDADDDIGLDVEEYGDEDCDDEDCDCDECRGDDEEDVA